VKRNRQIKFVVEVPGYIPVRYKQQLEIYVGLKLWEKIEVPELEYHDHITTPSI